METVEVSREREGERRKEGNNYLVGGENRKHTIQEKKLTRSLPFFFIACDDIISRD
jgi:hypothetical protein